MFQPVNSHRTVRDYLEEEILWSVYIGKKGNNTSIKTQTLLHILSMNKRVTTSIECSPLSITIIKSTITIKYNNNNNKKVHQYTYQHNHPEKAVYEEAIPFFPWG